MLNKQDYCPVTLTQININILSKYYLLCERLQDERVNGERHVCVWHIQKSSYNSINSRELARAILFVLVYSGSIN